MLNTNTARLGYLATLAFLGTGSASGCDYCLVLLAAALVLPVVQYNSRKLYQLYSTHNALGGVS